jgi:hypothetical protein
MSESNHPELHQLMDNLYQAGMSIEQVIEHGFDFAKYLSNDVITMRSDAHPQAAQAVRDVATELGISLIHQQKAMQEAKAHIRLLRDE